MNKKERIENKIKKEKTDRQMDKKPNQGNTQHRSEKSHNASPLDKYLHGINGC